MDASQMIAAFQSMTLGELTEFRRLFEQEFGVTAVAPVQVPQDLHTGGDEEPEAPTAFDVLLEAAGDKKVAVIKAVRETDRSLGLKEAKELVDAAPVVVARALTAQAAEAVRAKLAEAGAAVSVGAVS